MYFILFTISLFWTIPLCMFLFVVAENSIDKLVKTYLLTA